MKPIQIAIMFALLWTTLSDGHAALNIPGADGSDGALNITVSTNIDLGLAVTGPWDTNNTANAGKGVYDPAKWAVVFKYSSVTIANGANVAFKNHPSRAPVVWLVNGDVTVNGNLALNGALGGYDNPGGGPTEGGPGGFRGGVPGGPALGYSAGFGPGGSISQHGQYGQGLPLSYGNPSIIPLVGGSGGAGSSYKVGGGGGGAILIAAAGTVNISGIIDANGGGIYSSGHAGSGGAVRIVAENVTGSGTVTATSPAYQGRTRIEANSVGSSLIVIPPVQVVSPNPVTLWPPETAPAVRVVSVSGQSAPSAPAAAIVNAPADVTFASASPVSILLETRNFPINGTVKVFVKPRNASDSTYQATFVSGTSNQATWQVQQALMPGYSVIQARAVVP